MAQPHEQEHSAHKLQLNNWWFMYSLKNENQTIATDIVETRASVSTSTYPSFMESILVSQNYNTDCFLFFPLSEMDLKVMHLVTIHP